jgi:adenine deaminase
MFNSGVGKGKGTRCQRVPLSFVALQNIPTYGLSDKGLFDIRVQGEPILVAK